jgi:hypothetical protein
MALFDFLKLKQNKTSDILIPKVCPTNIPSEIGEKIDKINWADFETAYGNAEKTIPFYLKNLFCTDTEIAMDATHQLWCSLCHQHSYISTAALPSYEILKIGLLQLDNKLKIELLDIFQGFADCTSDKYFIAISQTPKPWEKELKEKLINDTTIFKELITSNDEGVSDFACALFSSLTNNEYNKT